MEKKIRSYDNVHWHISEITHQVVAKTGIPSDRHHLGKIILKCLNDAPDFLAQIDGGANKSESSGAMLKRIVKCATALRNLGLVEGDVMVLMSPTHIDLCIPFYAALCLGIYIAPADWQFTEKELSGSFGVIQPKIIFCQSDKASVPQNVINDLNIKAKIITFDKGGDWTSFSELLEKYADKTISVNNFRCTDFDPEETVAFLMPTSGTTGIPKSAMLTHKNLFNNSTYIWANRTIFPFPDNVYLISSPMQWLTAIMLVTMAPIIRFTRLHTSQPGTTDHIYNLIKKYKPSFALFSPNFATLLVKSENKDLSVLSSLTSLFLGGSAVPAEMLNQIKSVTPSTDIFVGFGMTELAGLGCNPFNSPVGSIGSRQGNIQYRIVDPDTQQDINEPNVSGELWMKGPCVFKGYYKNPAATKEAFAEGRWFKSGDLVYRDEHWNFYYVDRMKLLLKYRSYHISPVELEAVILQHPGVLDAAVTSRPDPECGDLAIACVVRRPGGHVTASEIKDLVKNSLAESKQLRGGVIFLDALPLTPSIKINRKKLKEMAVSMASND